MKTSSLEILRVVNFNNLFTIFKPEIIKYGYDTMDVYVKEEIIIKYARPTLNNILTNGFDFCWSSLEFYP